MKSRSKILITISLTFATADQLIAESMSAGRCERINHAVAGLTYHRSETAELTSGQIWRFEKAGTLRQYLAADYARKNAKSYSAHWRFVFEDNQCTLKVSDASQPPKTMTYRLTDVTWAIVTVEAGDRHVPDFEDHTGMKTRYCGVGGAYTRLWK